MTSGYEEAAGRRNLLERLGAKIPGFRGFQDRELRRDVDKLEREHLAAEVGRLKAALRERARAWTDAGRLDALTPFDRLDRRLDGFSQAVRFADYGATGFFDAVKIGEPELQRLYELDLSLLDDLGELAAAVAAVPAPGGDDPRPALDAVLARLAALEEKWAGREHAVGGVVVTR